MLIRPDRRLPVRPAPIRPNRCRQNGIGRASRAWGYLRVIRAEIGYSPSSGPPRNLDEHVIPTGVAGSARSQHARSDRFPGNVLWLIEDGEQQPAEHGHVLVELDPLLLAAGRVLDRPVRVPGQGGGDQGAGQGQRGQARRYAQR